jgi:hypothetical protein
MTHQPDVRKLLCSPEKLFLVPRSGGSYIPRIVIDKDYIRVTEGNVRVFIVLVNT